MSFLTKRIKHFFLISLTFLFLMGCSSIPAKIEEEGNSTNAFFLREDNLILVHIEPHTLRDILSGLPGSMPVIASQKISSAYIDYGNEDIRLKIWGNFPKNWINASLWEHRFDFSNESTLRETRFKSKKSPLYISLPNRNLIYISSQDFYSLEEENKLKNASSPASLNLVAKSQEYPLFLQVKDLRKVLSSLKIEVPAILRLPFNFLEMNLSLKEKNQTELTLIFGSDSKDPPPSLAVRFALNYILGKYPENPLSILWKRVPIIANPENSTQVMAILSLSEKELRKSLSIIYSGYLQEKVKKEKQDKLKSKTQEDPIDLLQDIIIEDSITPLLD